MITIPPSIRVARDQQAEGELLSRARQWLAADERESGVHVSDLLMPRRGYWRVVRPRSPLDREIGFFLVGKVLHAFVLHDRAGTPVNLRQTDEGSVYDEDVGVWYSPDRVAGDVVEEFKTSRSYYEPSALLDIEWYLRQVLLYMALSRKHQGRITVLYLNAKEASGKTSPQFRVYNVKVTAEELEAVRLEARRLRDELMVAVQHRQHRALPLCPDWACAPDRCNWWSDCQPEGRYHGGRST